MFSFIHDAVWWWWWGAREAQQSNRRMRSDVNFGTYIVLQVVQSVILSSSTTLLLRRCYLFILQDTTLNNHISSVPWLDTDNWLLQLQFIWIKHKTTCYYRTSRTLWIFLRKVLCIIHNVDFTELVHLHFFVM